MPPPPPRLSSLPYPFHPPTTNGGTLLRSLRNASRTQLRRAAPLAPRSNQSSSSGPGIEGLARDNMPECAVSTISGAKHPIPGAQPLNIPGAVC
eukprot:gene21793-biopygen8683